MALPEDPATDWFLTAVERGNAATLLDRRRGDTGTGEPLAWTDGNDATVLVDGASYFERLAAVLATVREGDWVYVTDLEGNADQRLAGPGSEVGFVLSGVAARGAHVRGLLWRSHPVAYSEVDNLLLTRAVNDAGGSVLLDHRIRAGGSHHQKIVVVRRHDDPAGDVAFVGGIDLAHGRRDGPEHFGDPQRASLSVSSYGEHPPWHDVQVELCGPVVDDVAYTFRERWADPTPLDRRNPLRALTARFARHPAERPPLAPDVTPPPCGDLAVQVLRTYPWRRRHPYPFAPEGERSIAAAYRKVFGRARSLVYLEDQYLWSLEAASALAEALTREPELRVVVVVPRYPDPDGRFTGAASRFGRHRVLETLYGADLERVAVYDLENRDDVPIYVHSKVCVVDDVWMSVGSDNLNRRSWTHDSEISCAIVDHVPAAAGSAVTDDGVPRPRRLPRETRLRLTREHLGRPGDDPLGDLTDPASWFDALREGARALDDWHRTGRVGARPPGHLRAHEAEPARRGPITSRLHARVLDPDGRPPRERRAP